VTPVRPISVVLEADFSAEPAEDGLTAMGDALLAALIDVGAIDPFVSIDARTNSLWSRSSWRPRAKRVLWAAALP
jgi:hypothetical protein